MTFPSPEARIYRRSVSIDFTIPKIPPVPNSAAPMADPPKSPGQTDEQGTVARYYVPLSLLKKWPPVIRLDLRSNSGDPVPLLTLFDAHRSSPPIRPV